MGSIRENPELRDKSPVFEDRTDAGKSLAEELKELESSEPWILAIPSGGVPVGVEVSKGLSSPLDLIIVRKIHIPWNPEAGFGSITSGGETFFNESLLERIDLSEDEIERQVKIEKKEMEKRMRKFRGNRPLPELKDETVVIVDDGMASGFSMLAAVKSVKGKDPDKIIVAVPTGSQGSVEKIGERVDELVCLNVRTGPVFAVAEAYDFWKDLTDPEVVEILENYEGYHASVKRAQP